MNPKVDRYLSEVGQWRGELEELRRILLDCRLTEELKWGSPCYSFQKANVAIIGGLKDACVLGFFKGALLKDAEGVLIKPGKNTRSARSIRFSSLQEIIRMEPLLRAYLSEAIEAEKAGMKVDFEEEAELAIPEEFQLKLSEMPHLKTAFDALTPGRRRAYLLYFSAPKQSKTRQSRVEKWMGPILKGKGLNDG